MAKDSVCGMEMDEKKALAKSQHLGRTYNVKKVVKYSREKAVIRRLEKVLAA
jgi:hypothetical protein